MEEKILMILIREKVIVYESFTDAFYLCQKGRLHSRHI